nr:immunoglobulin heavy chain junction region [Mus musculus]
CARCYYGYYYAMDYW